MPVPVVVLLCLLGMVVYGWIGVVVGVLSTYFMSDRPDRMASLAEWRESTKLTGSGRYYEDHRDCVVLCAAFWPLWLTLLTVIGICYVVWWGPFKVWRQTVAYVASSLDQKEVR